MESRPLRSLILLTLATALAFTGLACLGIWQIHRLHWKRELIEQTNRNALAPPVPAPSTATPRDAYLHVTVRGIFLHGRETLIHATTTAGAGYKVVTPLQTGEGKIILVNRGFVPPENRAPETRAGGQIQGETAVTGLLRLTEPGGRLLRSNNPAGNLWYSCDVTAIAAALHLRNTAPYYIDADAVPIPGGLPKGGLTVIDFPDNHLQYAITWFTLAILLAVFMIIFLRNEIRRR